MKNKLNNWNVLKNLYIETEFINWYNYWNLNLPFLLQFKAENNEGY